MAKETSLQSEVPAILQGMVTQGVTMPLCTAHVHVRTAAVQAGREGEAAVLWGGARLGWVVAQGGEQ